MTPVGRGLAVGHPNGFRGGRRKSVAAVVAADRWRDLKLTHDL